MAAEVVDQVMVAQVKLVALVVTEQFKYYGVAEHSHQV
jgi:hypothetical protein